MEVVSNLTEIQLNLVTCAARIRKHCYVLIWFIKLLHLHLQPYSPASFSSALNPLPQTLDFHFPHPQITLPHQHFIEQPQFKFPSPFSPILLPPFMAIADDGLQYTQSLVLGLIVSFLLAKLFSIVFSPGDEVQNLSLSVTNPNNNHHQTDGISSRKSEEKDKRSDAEFSMKHISSSDSDDDWEGVETTELDEAFCAATGFVAAIAADRSEQKVSKDFQLQLYGLYKIATEGACSAPQPSAIKIAARAKWNAWHKLGAMSPEEAMQKYLEIITELFPNWDDDSTSKRRGGGNNETSSEDTRPMGPDFSSFMHDEESGNE
ncbi:hypothetical protein SSX86_032449 [Deinandra increscens subsp. villosa]|uniref:ACB domain-containing protein n=1 Tax=Deinandra increscens subsp. villosa TaxID=3103831 RepID=A0AAP0GHT0_9ASTR